MEIRQGKTRMRDTKDNLVRVEEGYTCGCKEPSMKMTLHIDGTTFHSTTYTCDCGNTIEVYCERGELEKGNEEEWVD